jgi:hypothetical protein
VHRSSDIDVWGKTIPLLIALGIEALFVALVARL